MDRRTFLQMAGAGTAFGAIGLAANRAAIAKVTAKSARQPVGLNASETAIVPLKLVNIGDETVPTDPRRKERRP